jgi:hypothetical protein
MSDAEHVCKVVLGRYKGQAVLIMCPAGYAYTKMIEAAKAQRGELILVVLGPLTNVALACKLDPQLPSRGMSDQSFELCCLWHDSWHDITLQTFLPCKTLNSLKSCVGHGQ